MASVFGCNGVSFQLASTLPYPQSFSMPQYLSQSPSQQPWPLPAPSCPFTSGRDSRLRPGEKQQGHSWVSPVNAFLNLHNFAIQGQLKLNKYHMVGWASPAVIPVMTLAETYFKARQLKITAFLEALTYLATSPLPRLQLILFQIQKNNVVRNRKEDLQERAQQVPRLRKTRIPEQQRVTK